MMPKRNLAIFFWLRCCIQSQSNDSFMAKDRAAQRLRFCWFATCGFAKRVVLVQPVFVKQASMKNSRLQSGFLGLSFALLAVSAAALIASSAFQKNSGTPPVNDYADNGWRLTEIGWQDSTTWFVDSFRPRQIFELVHPLVWSMMVLILVIGAMVWSSNEWQIGRLFTSKSETEN